VSYDLFLEPEVHAAREQLPGNMRQRVRRAISALASAPRPPDSMVMDTADLELREGVELRRIRMERWRIVYAVCDEERWVWVLTVRRRPPYGYDDLPGLIARLPSE
jgi:mRNA-degrading endonuclease RelE of RelBE toxin-antitoxin system